jgi:hypothetical protein
MKLRGTIKLLKGMLLHPHHYLNFNQAHFPIDILCVKLERTMFSPPSSKMMTFWNLTPHRARAVIEFKKHATMSGLPLKNP